MSDTIRRTATNIIALIIGVVITFAGQGLYDYYVKAEKIQESYNLLMLRDDLKDEINLSVNQSVGEAFDKIEGTIKSTLENEFEKHVRLYEHVPRLNQ